MYVCIFNVCLFNTVLFLHQECRFLCRFGAQRRFFFYVSKGTQPVVNSKHIFEVMIWLLIQIRSHKMHNICEIAAQMRKCYQLFMQSV